MKIRDVMDASAVTVTEGTSMADAAALLIQTHVNDLPVIDADGTFVGILAEGDLLRHALPRFEQVVANAESVSEAYEMFLASGQHLADQPIDRAVIRNPILIGPDDELLKAAAVMISRNIRTLAVVEDGAYLGMISRANVCLGIFGRA